MTIAPSPSSILEIENLQVHFPIHKGFFRRQVGAVRAVDGVSFSIKRGEILGMVGESGCGKSTVAKSLVRALEPTGGSVTYHPDDGAPVEMAHLPADDLRPLRKEIRMIFQDPFSSMNPRMTVEEIIAGATREAARALGRIGEIGTLEVGKWCDLAIWDVERLAELPYRIGFNPLHARVWRGK